MAEKKVDVLIRGFLLSDLSARGVRLLIVGEGGERARLVALVSELGGDAVVSFLGQVSEVNELRHLYEDAICSVSPGYVGLSLTQSLGFGVPMLVSRDEPHSPELELARIGGVSFFDTDSPKSLAGLFNDLQIQGNAASRQTTNSAVRDTYSAEAMAAGITSALRNTHQELGADGWPTNQ
ncbi:glycosyltransferase [Cryobacterium breve]|uniref:Glycosyltransferase n=1 Tax=Cryobacterium breve TaxID=1259258 RepID=A0ABY7NA76_9MICO|nr:glycosyltransferase [Cryobacterium breve]